MGNFLEKCVYSSTLTIAFVRHLIYVVSNANVSRIVDDILSNVVDFCLYMLMCTWETVKGLFVFLKRKVRASVHFMMFWKHSAIEGSLKYKYFVFLFYGNLVNIHWEPSFSGGCYPTGFRCDTSSWRKRNWSIKLCLAYIFNITISYKPNALIWKAIYGPHAPWCDTSLEFNYSKGRFTVERVTLHDAWERHFDLREYVSNIFIKRNVYTYPEKEYSVMLMLPSVKGWEGGTVRARISLYKQEEQITFLGRQTSLKDNKFWNVDIIEELIIPDPNDVCKNQLFTGTTLAYGALTTVGDVVSNITDSVTKARRLRSPKG